MGFSSVVADVLSTMTDVAVVDRVEVVFLSVKTVWSMVK